MDYSLSGKDLMEFCSGRAKIVTYPDLQSYKDIDELLKPHGVVFLLYEFKRFYGHWTLIYRRDDGGIECFDSYSYKPDEEFTFIPEYFRAINDMVYPRLTKMLLDSNKDIHYNNFKLQRESNNIATCGRWCLVRLLFKHMDIDKFYKMMKFIRAKTGLSFDEIVFHMTDEFPKQE